MSRRPSQNPRDARCPDRSAPSDAGVIRGDSADRGRRGNLASGATDSDLTPYDLGAGTREHYEDPALYDFEYRRRRADVNFYRRLARELAGPGRGLSILELGCGTGRVLAPLVRDGHRVVGLDLSASMLRVARARIARLPRPARARAILLRADMRRFAFATRFSLVICPFHAFQHLYTRFDVTACLACVKEHLAPDGRFAFDVLFPDLRWLTRDSRRRWARTRFRHPRTGERLEYTTNETYDPVTQIAHIRIYYEPLDVPPSERRTRVVRLAHRQFFPMELDMLLACHGFRIERRFGGFDEEPLAEDSQSQVIVARISDEKP